YNILRKRYFDHARGLKAREEIRVQPGMRHFTPWDDLVYRYARQYGFDWRLILAQMYQESRFDPKRVSWAGARGLMQVTPRTARAHGFDPEQLADPEVGIHAGVAYLDWLRDRFPETLDVRDRLWFALASYNAGLGHVRDARRLARQLGLNPDRWFGHVEQAMLKLSRKQYYRKAKHGFVRGREPVRYVRDIRDRYRAYVALSKDWPPPDATPPLRPEAERKAR
ncbi:MAG TPA: lytic transglycosylase F, partial [Chromatiales bacterium]|nr:lytic transglycosylase F [Chromatiales bacterium]